MLRAERVGHAIKGCLGLSRDLRLTWRPALAEWDFCDFVAASFGPAFPPTDLPLPPAMSRVM